MRRQQHLTAGFGYWSDDDAVDVKDKGSDKDKGGADKGSDKGSLTASNKDKEKDKEKGKDAKGVRTARAGRGSGAPSAPGSDKSGKASLLPNSQFLHLLLRAQVQSVMASLHDEIAATWARRLHTSSIAQQPFALHVLLHSITP